MNYRFALNFLKRFRVNFVVKILIMSDFMVIASSNFLAPIFAIFIMEQIPGANLETIGFAASIYFITKAIFEIPAGLFIDRTRSECDDLTMTVIGTVLTAVIYFSYVWIRTIPMLFLAQGLLGLSAAICYPGWYSMFTRHVDKSREAYEWSLYDVIMGFGIAVSATIGAFVVNKYGFDVLFVLLGLLTLVGSALLFTIRHKIYRK